MRKKLILLIAVFLLAACSTLPATPQPGAVETAVAQTVAAWTAAAPAPTSTPVPPSTPTPTAMSPGQTDETGDDLLLPEATAAPTSTESDTNLIIDVTAILGKPVPEVEGITGNSVFITPNDDNDDVLAGGEYRDYEIGKYYIFLSFDEDGIARGFQVLDGLSSENYALNDWETLLARFGLNVTAPPDQVAPAALYWYNYNGYGIAIVSGNTSGKPVRTVQIEDSNVFMR